MSRIKNKQKQVNITISLNINEKNILKSHHRSNIIDNPLQQQLTSLHQDQKLTITDKIFSKELIEAQAQKIKSFKKHRKINSLNFKEQTTPLYQKIYNPVKHQRKPSYETKNKTKLNTIKNNNIIKKINNTSINQNPHFNSSLKLQCGVKTDRKIQNINSLKQFIATIITKQVTKYIKDQNLKVSLTKKQQKNIKKNLTKTIKPSNNRLFLQRKEQQLQNAQLKIIPSLRDMNESLITTEQLQDLQKPLQKSFKRQIKLQTTQSIDLIQEIKQFQKITQTLSTNKQTDVFNHLSSENIYSEDNTYRIIQGYVGILKQIYTKDLNNKKQTQGQVYSHNYSADKYNFRESAKSKISFCDLQQSSISKYKNQRSQNKQSNSLKKQDHSNELKKWKQMLTYFISNIDEKSQKNTIIEVLYKFMNDTQINITEILKDKRIQNKSSIVEDLQSEGQEQRQIKLITKNNLQKIEQDQSFMKISNQILDQFEDIVNESSQQDMNVKMINFNAINNILKKRSQDIEEKMHKDIRRIYQKFKSGRISQEELKKQKERIQKWGIIEGKKIKKIKKSFDKGYKEVKTVINQINFTDIVNSSTENVMMKCLSANYLHKKQSLQDTKTKSKSKQQQQDKSCLSSSFQIQSIRQKLEDLKQSHEKTLSLNKKEETKEAKQQNLFQSQSINYGKIDKSFQDKQIKQSLQQGIILNKAPILNQISKLSYLTDDDKEDIFQFIFLDITIQIMQESFNNKIMSTINKYISKSKQNNKKMKGLRTNINVVKEYLKRFISYILRTQKELVKSINCPMGPTPLQILRYAHLSDDNYSNLEEQAIPTVIPFSAFDLFEKSILSNVQFEPYYSDDEQQEKRVDYLKNILHIHNKAIFDSLNQNLDYQRPFGIWGIPFPWKTTSRYIHFIQNDKIQQILKQCCNKVANNCAYVCGLLKDKEQSLVGKVIISEQYLQSIRQDRLSRLLASDLIENQQRWLFFDDEEAECLIQISHYIFNQIIFQETKFILQKI